MKLQKNNETKNLVGNSNFCNVDVWKAFTRFRARREQITFKNVTEMINQVQNGSVKLTKDATLVLDGPVIIDR